MIRNYLVNKANVLSKHSLSIPANRSNLIGIVLIFEFQNLQISGHSCFQEGKKVSFVKIWNWVLKDWS